MGWYDIILRTTDGGTSWTSKSIGTGDWFYSVSFIDASKGWVVGSIGTILHTTDGGASWTSQSSGTWPDLYSVSFTDGNTGTAVGYDGTILRTTNGGALWTMQISGTTTRLFGVSFIDANTGTAVGDGGTILRTTNGGAQWTSQMSGTTQHIWSVSFTDANTGTAVGWYGTILRTNTGGVTAVEEYESAAIPAGFSLMQNYPNPFNPSTTIRYELPRESYVTLKVYNVLGQEVATLVNEKREAGRYEVEFDGAMQPSGLYFYRLQVGTYIETKKFLLLK